MCGRFALAISQEELSGSLKARSLKAHFAEQHQENNSNHKRDPGSGGHGGDTSNNHNNNGNNDRDATGSNSTNDTAEQDGNTGATDTDMQSSETAPGSTWHDTDYANYNTAPGQFSPVIQLAHSSSFSQGYSHHPDGAAGAAEKLVDVDVRPLHWGFKSVAPGMSTFNARSETIASSPLWRRAGRCVVPMEGYYEWYVSPESNKKLGKVPYYVHPASSSSSSSSSHSTDKDNNTTETETATQRKPKTLLWVAGLMSPDKTCFSVVTAAAQGSSVEWLHGRVPLLLTDPLAWLQEGKPGPRHDPGSVEIKTSRAGQPPPAHGQGKDGLAWHRVGAEVGSVKNHGPQLCKPYVEKTRLLTSYFGQPASATLRADGGSLSTTGPRSPAAVAAASTDTTQLKRKAPATPATPPPKKAKAVKSNAKITRFFKHN